MDGSGARLRLAKQRRANSKPSRIRGHNFAIMLLQTLEARTDQIVRGFKEAGEKRGRSNYYVDRPTFVEIMKRAAERGPSSPYEDSWIAEVPPGELAQRIGEVFDGSDPHSKGKICFEDVMNYVIDCSLYGDVGHVQEPIPEFVATDGGAFPNLEEITKARFVPELGKLLTAGKTLGVINPVTMQAQCIAPYDVKDKLSRVYDADYIPHMQAALLVGTDLNIDIISLDTGKTIFRVPTTETHSVCAFDRSTSMALIGRGSVVETFSAPPQRSGDVKFAACSQFEHHTDLVYRILPMPQHGLVATGSADKTAVVTDYNTGNVVSQFTGHTSAVHCIRYLPNMNMMASCAYDTEPRLWMMGASSRRNDAFTLRDMDQPHTGHVVDLCTAEDTPIVASLDVTGVVKIWDIRTMKCRQNIKLTNSMTGIFDAGKLGWHSLQYDSVRGELAACAQRRLQKVKLKIPRGGKATMGQAGAGPQQEDAAVSAKAGLADEYAIVVIAANNTNQTLLMCSEKHVRVWDVFTGRQEAAFENLVPPSTTISSACVSSNGQTFFLGFRTGAVTQYLYSSGAVLRTVTRDGPEVAQLVYLEGCQTIATVTARGCLLSLDRMANDAPEFFPDYPHGPLTKLAHYDPVLRVLAAAGKKGQISLFESRRGDFTPDGARISGEMSVGQTEISCLQLLNGYPVAAVSTNAGTLALYTIAPHPTPNRKFAETLMKSRELLHMAFYPVKCVLYAADEQGYLHAFSLADALDSVGISSASTSWTAAVTGVGRSGCAPRETVLLHTSLSVRAHTEIVSGLVWVRGANLLASASLDKRVLLWTLNLDFVGELDPNVETGKFSVPVSLAAADSYVIEPPGGENIMFLGLKRQMSMSPLLLQRGASSFRKTRSIRIKKDESSAEPGDTATADSTNNGAGLVNQAQFAEDVHRVAMELESFVPSKAQLTKSQRDAERIQALGSHEPAQEGADYGRQSLTHPAGGPQPIAVSSNSCGVNHRSLFSPAPLLPTRSKTHVVAEGGTDGGESFVVTQDHPLPNHFKAERDLILRHLVQQEQLRRSRAEEGDGALPPSPLMPIAVTPQLDVRRASEVAAALAQHRTTTQQLRAAPEQAAGAAHVCRSRQDSRSRGLLAAALLPCDLIRLHSSQQSHGRAAHEALLMHRRSLTPQPLPVTRRIGVGPGAGSALPEDIEWSPASLTPQARNAAQQTPQRLFPSVSAPVEDVGEALGFCSFGVRSLQSVLQSSAEGRPWARTHRVDMPGQSEVPVPRPQSIFSVRQAPLSY
jgi:WD40 repeat protein